MNLWDDKTGVKAVKGCMGDYYCTFGSYEGNEVAGFFVFSQ